MSHTARRVGAGNEPGQRHADQGRHHRDGVASRSTNSAMARSGTPNGGSGRIFSVKWPVSSSWRLAEDDPAERVDDQQGKDDE